MVRYSIFLLHYFYYVFHKPCSCSFVLVLFVVSGMGSHGASMSWRIRISQSCPQYWFFVLLYDLGNQRKNTPVTKPPLRFHFFSLSFLVSFLSRSLWVNGFLLIHAPCCEVTVRWHPNVHAQTSTINKQGEEAICLHWHSHLCLHWPMHCQ
ncbi:MAG: hypothetical protein J3R72DRAFT_452655 [Linnemannia gamsii]|nr:MAG: hypothetical protein J3R72DRAFT_452655 [Linnemannia gamsii]